MKKKANLSSIPSPIRRKCVLDPSPTDSDRSIREYHERTQQLLPSDRSTHIHALVPGDAPSAKVKVLQQFWFASIPFKLIFPQSLSLEKKEAELKTTLLETQIEEMKKELKVLRESKLSLCVSNALVELLKGLSKKFRPDIPNDDTSTNKLQQFGKNLTDQQLRQFNVPTKYWKMIRNADLVGEHRFCCGSC